MGPGKSQLDALGLAMTSAPNFGLETHHIIEKLRDLDERFGLDIRIATTDSVVAKFRRRPDDAASLAAEIIEFCPDANMAEDLETRLGNLSLDLWWD